MTQEALVTAAHVCVESHIKFGNSLLHAHGIYDYNINLIYLCLSLAEKMINLECKNNNRSGLGFGYRWYKIPEQCGT